MSRRPEVGGEAQEEPDVGAAKAVDRLVRIADDAEVAVRRHEPAQEGVLHRVHVLELVHRDVCPPPAQILCYGRVALEQLDR